MTQAPGKLAQAPAVPHIVTELPGPKARAHLEFDRQWTSPSVPRAYPLVPVRGEGCTIEDIDGNLLLDFNAGIAVTSTGHCHPDVVRAIQDQAGKLLHYSADFYLPIYAEMCAELARIAPMKEKCRVFLGNSGTEAVEGAIKLARFATRRQYLVAFLGAFHGRSYGSVSLTASKAKYHAGFGPMLPGVFHAPFGHVADLRWFDDVLFDKLVPPDEVAAIILEPIQGEGGYVVPEDGFIQGLRRICDKHGILLIADEVQSRRRPDRQDVGHPELGRGAGHRRHRQGHRQRHAPRRVHRPRLAHDEVGPRRPRHHVRRQPARLRRLARDDQAARGRADGQREGARRRAAGRASRPAGAVPVGDPRRPRHRPHDRRRVRHATSVRRPSSGAASSAACSCWRPATRWCASRRRSSSRPRRPPPV